MRMQVILDSSFARPGSAPTWGGKKGEFRDWTKNKYAMTEFNSKLAETGNLAVVVDGQQTTQKWSFHVVALQRTAKKCTEIYIACAQPLFCKTVKKVWSPTSFWKERASKNTLNLRNRASLANKATNLCIPFSRLAVFLTRTKSPDLECRE